MSKTVKQGQSFLDKAIELTGSVENAFAMAKLNGLSVSSELAIGAEIMPSAITKKSIVQQWDEKNAPASAMTNAQQGVILPPEGIGAMIIEDTFIVY